jgi:hypothetical protein
MLWRYTGIAIGVWFIFAPFIWGYPLGFIWWHSIGIGAAVVALSASFLVRWLVGAGLLLILVGLYALVSPAVYAYYTQQFALWNDIFFGVATILTGAMLSASALEYGRGGSALA